MRLRTVAGWHPPAVAAALLSIGLLVDHLPRFFQGDSISYLSTDGVYIPPDRSWAYGFAVNWLLRVTHGYMAYIIIQLGLLLGALALCSVFFRPVRRPAIFTVFIVLACMDPMVELYARFYMTDLVACLLFVTFLACLCLALRAPRNRFLPWMALLLVLVVAAVATRVAYAPVIVLTVLLAGVSCVRTGEPVGRLAAILALPPLAVAVLVAANGVVFANRFPGERFITKLSGVFLLGTFAPALVADDFRAAGLDVSDSDIQALDLQDYDKRSNQIWGDDIHSAQVLIRQRLGVSKDYTALVDRVSSRVVMHAALRDPLAIGRVFGTTLLFHFSPAQWQRHLDHEVGMTRLLPQGFVDFFNRVSHSSITARIVEEPSPALTVFRWIAPAYPVLLGAGLLAALGCLLVGRGSMGRVLVSAGLAANLLTVPLYTVYVIPRYVIAAVLLSYLLGTVLLADKPGSPLSAAA